MLGLDYSFDKSSRPLSFLFPLSICLWTISQVSPLCSTKERRKIKPNWSNYFIAGVLIYIRRVKPLTKSTKGERNTSWSMALYQVLWYLEIYFISKYCRPPFFGGGGSWNRKKHKTMVFQAQKIWNWWWLNLVYHLYISLHYYFYLIIKVFIDKKGLTTVATV